MPSNLTIDALLAAARPADLVPLEAWGGTLYLRRLTVGDIDGLGDELDKVKLFCLSACDESGQPLVTTAEQQEQLAQLDAATFARVLNAIYDLNGLAEDTDAVEKKS